MDENRGVAKFKSGYNCAQAVFSSYADRLGLEEDHCLKLATGFGGGMARAQEVCGAVSGGILAIGAMDGRGLSEGKDQQELVYSKVKSFMEAFAEKEGSVRCFDLLGGCDLRSPEGRNRFVQEGLAERCHGCIATATRILDKMLFA